MVRDRTGFSGVVGYLEGKPSLGEVSGEQEKICEDWGGGGNGRHRARACSQCPEARASRGIPGRQQWARGEHGWETYLVACHDGSSCPLSCVTT